MYVGMTDDLAKRIWMHKEEVLPGFTKDHGVKLLVWYEVHPSRERDGLHARTTNQEVESRLETRVDRESQSKLA